MLLYSFFILFPERFLEARHGGSWHVICTTAHPWGTEKERGHGSFVKKIHTNERKYKTIATEKFALLKCGCLKRGM